MNTRTELPRLSTLFTCPRLAAIFAAAEHDNPPEALAVETPRAPLLPSRGEARQLEIA